jgi:pimeloyl-ACP methyl ester carboxylesterase
VIRLPSGAELRRTGPADAAAAVVCVNGGQGGEVEGTWSASLEWLVGRIAARFPRLAFGEVRYRVKSWNRLDWCVQDAREAMDAVGGDRVLLLGFSMGGAVAVRAAGDPRVDAVIGLAPWLPDRLDVSSLRGRRLRVLHGTLDRWLPGIPGVSPASSRRGFERARRAGASGEYTLIPGAVHGIALRAHRGRPVPLPRARTWARLVGAELARYADG